MHQNCIAGAQPLLNVPILLIGLATLNTNGLRYRRVAT
jgi:hypothetical protein